MRLFVFQATWDFCNGAVLVIAASRAKAVALANKASRHEAERRNYGGHDHYIDNKKSGEWTFGLTFVESFPVKTQPERVVLDAWNWA